MSRVNNSDNYGVLYQFYNFKKNLVFVLTLGLLGDNILIVREGTQHRAENKASAKTLITEQ